MRWRLHFIHLHPENPPRECPRTPRGEEDRSLWSLVGQRSAGGFLFAKFRWAPRV